MKIRPAGTEFFYEEKRTGRQEDMNKLIVAFHNFANAPKNSCFDVQYVYLSHEWPQKNERCLGWP